MIPSRWSNFALPVAFLTIALVPSSLAADSCQPVFDALTKVATTPRHTYSTHTAAFTHGKPRTSETVMAGGKVYIRVNEKWMQSPVSPQEMVEQQRENHAHANGTCQFMRNELVGSEAAAVYSMHNETADGKEDAQVWISKSTGLLLRDEQDVDLGSTRGKEHRSTRFEYGNIRPPM